MKNRPVLPTVFARLFVAGLFLLVTPSAWAAICTITNTPVLAFGNVDPFTTTPITSQVTLDWQCARTPTEQSIISACIYVSLGDGSTSGNPTPRELAPTAGTPTLSFNVYEDAALTQVVGQHGLSVTNGVRLDAHFGEGLLIVNGSVTLHGQLNAPLPGNAHAGLHDSLMVNSEVSLDPLGNCETSTLPVVSSTYTLQATATVEDQCLVTASNLNFGTQNTPLAQTDGQSALNIRCSSQTPFTIGLDDGLNGTRLMSNGSQTLSYELYKDSNRLQRWGNGGAEVMIGTGLGTGSIINLDVFGRVFAAPSAPAGTYSDTITVTATF